MTPEPTAWLKDYLESQESLLLEFPPRVEHWWV